MTWRNTIVFFVLSYLLGWGLYAVNSIGESFNIFYVMGLFVFINIFTIFHPLIFHYGVMRPLQLSISSVGILSFLEGNEPIFLFSMLLVLTMLFIEKEDVFSVVLDSKNKRIGNLFRMTLLSCLLPFSVTYCVMIIRPYESISSLIIVISYFAVLFVVSKWFSTIVSFSIFALIQMVLMVFLYETYLDWSSAQITIFFISIFVFLLTSYGRKGLLNYSSNNI